MVDLIERYSTSIMISRCLCTPFGLAVVLRACMEVCQSKCGYTIEMLGAITLGPVDKNQNVL
jgi:hypothetical protein